MRKMETYLIIALIGIVIFGIGSIGMIMNITTISKSKTEDTLVKEVYGFYKDGEWIKPESERLQIREKVLGNNKDSNRNILIGEEALVDRNAD